MTRLRCECGDSECPSCGEAQGTRTRTLARKRAIHEAIDKLARLYPYGALEADTDPVGFVLRVMEELCAKRRLMVEAVRDFHGRAVLFSSAFLAESQRTAPEGSVCVVCGGDPYVQPCKACGNDGR